MCRWVHFRSHCPHRKRPSPCRPRNSRSRAPTRWASCRWRRSRRSARRSRNSSAACRSCARGPLATATTTRSNTAAAPARPWRYPRPPHQQPPLSPPLLCPALNHNYWHSGRHRRSRPLLRPFRWRRQ